MIETIRDSILLDPVLLTTTYTIRQEVDQYLAQHLSRLGRFASKGAVILDYPLLLELSDQEMDEIVASLGYPFSISWVRHIVWGDKSGNSDRIILAWGTWHGE